MTGVALFPEVGAWLHRDGRLVQYLGMDDNGDLMVEDAHTEKDEETGEYVAAIFTIPRADVAYWKAVGE